MRRPKRQLLVVRRLCVEQRAHLFFRFFFFNDTATTEIYTLSLHDALPISAGPNATAARALAEGSSPMGQHHDPDDLDHQDLDRKSTRLNSSHQIISYA